VLGVGVTVVAKMFLFANAFAFLTDSDQIELDKVYPQSHANQHILRMGTPIFTP
jgi:hypothetical protein